MKILPLLPVAISAVSCYPLPSPTYSVNRYGLDATLVDATSGEPLRRTEVSLVIDSFRSEQRTSRAGTLRLPASKIRYWTWLGGPIQESAPGADIVIESEGFQPGRIEWSMLDDSRLPVDHGRVQAGIVTLRKE